MRKLKRRYYARPVGLNGWRFWWTLNKEITNACRYNLDSPVRLCVVRQDTPTQEAR